MRRSAGFTLLEVVVALALAGLVALLAVRLYGGLLDAAARVETSRERLDRWANGRRLLIQLVGSIEVGLDKATVFRGEPHGASFTAWLPDARGWPAQRAVTLTADSGRLVARGLGERSLPLADGVTALDFDYLLAQGADARWMRAFIAEFSAPLAIRMRIAARGVADTLILIVGRRG